MNSPYGLPPECLSCHLRPNNFFCALSQESVEALSHIKYSAVFPDRALIFIEGQTPRGIFLLCQGQAKLSVTARDGKTLILRIAKAGEVLGLDAVVRGKPYEVTVETMQPCQTNFVIRDDFLRFLKEHGDARLQAVQHLSRDCREAYDTARSIGLAHSVSARVAKFFLASATEGQVMNGVLRAKIALTHDEIAQLTGTSRETITRTLSEFRKKGIIELKGSTLTIHNKAALERLVTA
jgi:CRP/FNR family transcriptional regulator, cyclic AMP receptor protein